MAAAPRGPASLFKSAKQLKKLSAATTTFLDTSSLEGFVEGSPPYTPDQARSAAQRIQEAAEDDDRLNDGVTYRFMVGGIACKGVEAYRKMIAAAATTAAFKTALESNPAEHGAAPWQTLATECAQRNGGLIKGPPGALVAASRDETYEAAAQAALAVFECGGQHALALEACSPLLQMCHKAGSRCPLDTAKIKQIMAARTVERAVAQARELGAGTEDVPALAAALANVQTWLPSVNVEEFPQLAPDAVTDITDMIDIVTMHHAPEFSTAAKAAAAARTAALG